MKPHRKPLLMLLLCLITAVGYSQADTRPKIFENFPESIVISDAKLQNLFQSVDGQDINLAVSSSFNFPGRVLSNVAKYNNLQSITIKSEIFNNAILHLSRIKNDDGSISFVGRILNEHSFDGYEIVRNLDGTYIFKKFETGKVMQDCSF
ncbi:MAG: hypothetical protein ABIY51_05270 [Ferruginibacter sp.]